MKPYYILELEGIDHLGIERRETIFSNLEDYDKIKEFVKEVQEYNNDDLKLIECFTGNDLLPHPFIHIHSMYLHRAIDYERLL